MAMRNPNDLMAIDDLGLITGREILPVVVSDVELNAVIEQFANISTSLEQSDDLEKTPSSTASRRTAPPRTSLPLCW